MIVSNCEEVHCFVASKKGFGTGERESMNVRELTAQLIIQSDSGVTFRELLQDVF